MECLECVSFFISVDIDSLFHLSLFVKTISPRNYEAFVLLILWALLIYAFINAGAMCVQQCNFCVVIANKENKSKTAFVNWHGAGVSQQINGMYLKGIFF